MILIPSRAMARLHSAADGSEVELILPSCPVRPTSNADSSIFHATHGVRRSLTRRVACAASSSFADFVDRGGLNGEGFSAARLLAELSSDQHDLARPLLRIAATSRDLMIQAPSPTQPNDQPLLPGRTRLATENIRAGRGWSSSSEPYKSLSELPLPAFSPPPHFPFTPPPLLLLAPQTLAVSPSPSTFAGQIHSYLLLLASTLPLVSRPVLQHIPLFSKPDYPPRLILSDPNLPYFSLTMFINAQIALAILSFTGAVVAAPAGPMTIHSGNGAIDIPEGAKVSLQCSRSPLDSPVSR